MAALRNIARICRSKNAGPFLVTLDIVFDDRDLYERVKRSGVLNAELFARLYGVRPDEVLFTPYDAGLAFKATLPRLVCSGDLGDTDVYGCQQHAPLLEVEVPV